MPTLDVSEILTDPLFSRPLTIERRIETVGNNGRATKQVSQITPKPYGVITSASDDRRILTGDAQYRADAIRVITKFRLSGPAPGREPDVIVYNSSRYVVLQIDDYSDYGVGFTSALCSSTDTLDQPPS